MRSPIAGASVLITGGASGIGKELALSAAHRGATQVIIWDIDAEAAHAVVREIQSFGGSATAYRVDLADPAHVAAAGEETIAAYGRVDILINSAGIVTGKEFLDLTEEDITRTFNLNVFALYRVTKVFLPGMIARGKGSITAITSAAGLIGVARQTDYSASKFAATGFIESLRAELRHRGPRSTPSMSSRSTSTPACSTGSTHVSHCSCRSSMSMMLRQRFSTRLSPVANPSSCRGSRR